MLNLRFSEDRSPRYSEKSRGGVISKIITISTVCFVGTLVYLNPDVMIEVTNRFVGELS